MLLERISKHNVISVNSAETHLEQSQTSAMESFCKLLTIFAKKLHGRCSTGL